MSDQNKPHGLTVAELIGILQTMPPDALVVASDLHVGDSVAVGMVVSRSAYDRTPRAMIGNWAWVPRRTDSGDPWDLSAGFYFAKNNYGDTSVRRMKLVLKPGERYQTWATREARVESVPAEDE